MWKRYLQHRHNARQRGIAFTLTYDEWLSIWANSGKLDLCGNRRGQYCMARYGDRGGYEAGNVRICLIEENRAERNQNYPLAGEHNAAYGKNYWAILSDEEYRERVASLRDKLRGKSKSDHMRLNLSRTITGRRRICRQGSMTWAYPGDIDYPPV